MNEDNNMYFWTSQGDGFVGNYYEADYDQLQNQPLDFKPLEEYEDQIPGNNGSEIFNPTPISKNVDFTGEPPLLEELEIYPDRILQKILAVLNPLGSHGLTDDAEYLTKDPDLAGPISFYLILAMSLYLSGNKAHFGYIYGISVMSCLMMYCLLSLMTSNNSVISLTIVASVLGYSLIPIVGLSLLGMFLTLQGLFGVALATLAVIWSSISASRLFVAISGDTEQQPLVAYPCALVSGVYVLLILF